MIKPIAQLSAMAPYELATLDDSLTSLSQNESLLPPSPAALEAGKKALSSATLYPDPDWTELRHAIASVHDINEQQILCGAGSMELIAACIHAYAGINVDSILSKVTTRTRIVFVCNPGNPTGTRIPNTELVRLRDQLPPNVLLIIDQAYAEFDAQNHNSIFELVDRENTVVLRTFSKAYCLAGQRLGWGTFPESIAREVKKLLNPNNVSIVTQAMGISAILDQSYLKHVVDFTSKVRNEFRDKLAANDVHTPESHTNFVLVPFLDANRASDVNNRLKAAGFLTRGMGGYGLDHCLRITMASSDVMDAVSEQLIQGN